MAVVVLILAVVVLLIKLLIMAGVVTGAGLTARRLLGYYAPQWRWPSRRRPPDES